MLDGTPCLNISRCLKQMQKIEWKTFHVGNDRMLHRPCSNVDFQLARYSSEIVSEVLKKKNLIDSSCY